MELIKLLKGIKFLLLRYIYKAGLHPPLSSINTIKITLGVLLRFYDRPKKMYTARGTLFEASCIRFIVAVVLRKNYEKKKERNKKEKE